MKNMKISNKKDKETYYINNKHIVSLDSSLISELRKIFKNTDVEIIYANEINNLLEIIKKSICIITLYWWDIH
ncbi:MAG: hypothetical protein RRZ84_08910 [Romboutsia sp.]